MKKKLTLLLVFALVLTMIPAPASAALKSAGSPTEVQTLVSSENLEHNFVKVTANGSTLHIEAETPVKSPEYNISVRQKGRNSSDWAGRTYATDMGDYCTFSYDLSSTIRSGSLDGDYVLLITKTVGSKTGPVIYKNCAFRVTNGQFTILQYDKIIKENARIDKNANKKKKASAFKKTNLSDVKTICFRDPVSKKVASVTKKKVNYFKTVSDQIVAGATTDYEKLLKIYEYVAENFYYDDIAFATGTRQYIDPYRNLYNMRKTVPTVRTARLQRPVSATRQQSAHWQEHRASRRGSSTDTISVSAAQNTTTGRRRPTSPSSITGGTSAM